jgi:hypothetical protein
MCAGEKMLKFDPACDMNAYWGRTGVAPAIRNLEITLRLMAWVVRREYKCVLIPVLI